MTIRGSNPGLQANGKEINTRSRVYKNFYDSLKNVKVIFHKVKGHSGVELNEAVDRLAKAALGI